MLAGELTGHRVKAAHAFDRHEECLIRRQSGLGQPLDLIAEVPLQLLHVGLTNRPTAAQIAPPMCDLFIQQRALRGYRHAGQAFNQIPRSVLSTTCHCCC